MTGQLTWLVCYDICDAKRLRLVYRILRGFGEHWQYSVFLCELSAQRKVELLSALEDVINFSEDQVLFAPLGPVGGRNDRRIETLGKPQARSNRGPRVI